MNLSIKDILKCTKGKLVTGNEKEECINYSRDTRTIKNGDTYIAIKGENFDGNLFWEEAIKKGANTVILNNMNITEEKRNEYKNKNIILVDDTVKAIGEMAKYKMEIHKKKYNLKVVGVTGSVGKTSTKDIIANVLSKKYKVLKLMLNH